MVSAIRFEEGSPAIVEAQVTLHGHIPGLNQVKLR